MKIHQQKSEMSSTPEAKSGHQPNGSVNEVEASLAGDFTTRNGSTLSSQLFSSLKSAGSSSSVQVPGSIIITNVKPVPTFGYAFLLIFGMVNFALSYGMPTSMSAFFLDWQETFKVSRAQAATVHATCLGILNTGAIIPGYLMNRFGARPTLLIGSFLASSGLLLSVFATTITHMVISSGVLTGLGFCMLNLPVIPCVTQAFNSRRSVIISCLSFGSSISNAGLTYFYRYLSNELSWQGAFFIIAGIAFNSCITGLIITSYIWTPLPKVVAGAEEHLLIDEEITLDLKSGTTLTDDHQGNGFNKYRECQYEITPPPFIAEKITCEDRDNTDASESFTSSENNGTSQSGCYSKVYNSKFTFILNPLYLLIVVNTALCIPCIGALIFLVLDFAKNKGFMEESSGVFFLFIAFLSSAFGKILCGLLNLIPKLKSVFIMVGFDFLGAAALVLLTYLESYGEIAFSLALLGLCYGGLSGIYPKCVLDSRRVDAKTFPLALGIANSAEGIFDSSTPILMGLMVDIQGSYTFPLLLYASVCSVSAVSLLLVYIFKKR